MPAKRFVEFFTATIRNKHTRKAYARATGDFFVWCQQLGLALPAIEPLHVAAYIEQITTEKSAPTVKQHLAAVRMCFDWLTSGGIMDFNPASSVRGRTHIVKQGKTPVLTAGEAKQLSRLPILFMFIFLIIILYCMWDQFFQEPRQHFYE